MTTPTMVEISIPGGWLRVLPTWAAQADAAWFDPAHVALQAEPVSAGGRQAAWFVSGPFGQGVLRHYRRGGLVARLVRDQYLWLGKARTRAFQEADILNWMQAQGLPVPRAVAAACWHQGLGYRAAIIVERLAGVKPLALTLTQPEAVAKAVHAMHEAGVWHADLNAFNILLDEAGKAWLIDFDRARRVPMTASRRQANLLRLRRSLIKVAGDDGLRFWTQLNQIYHSI